MIPSELLQKDIITTLKANSALITALAPSGTASVLENQFQGQNFIYPAIRVDILPQTPIGTGTDRTRLSTVSFAIRSYSEKSSGYEANHLITLVTNALFNKQIDGTNESNQPYYRLLRININNVDGAFRVASRLWMAVAIFEGEANLINPP